MRSVEDFTAKVSIVQKPQCDLDAVPPEAVDLFDQELLEEVILSGDKELTVGDDWAT